LAGAAAVLLAWAACSADDSPFVSRLVRPRVLAAETAAEKELSPLEALKRRSPERRWDERKAAFGQPSATESPTGVPARTAEQPVRVPSFQTETSPSVGGAPPSREIIPEVIPELPETPGELPPSTTNVNEAPFRFDALPVLEVIQQAPEPARDPAQLKKVTQILPYFDYEPDDETRKDDPCRYLCPRPDGKSCKEYPAGSMAPACPEEISINGIAFQGRAVPASVFSWEASNLWYNPLYFEDPQLERYGHTHHELIQPFVSTGRFGAQLLGLPYQMTIDPLHKRMYPLGWYRPGDCAPYKHYQIPWNTHAAITEAGVLTGLFYLFP
jgi:hypothetical protein